MSSRSLYMFLQQRISLKKTACLLFLISLACAFFWSSSTLHYLWSSRALLQGPVLQNMMVNTVKTSPSASKTQDVKHTTSASIPTSPSAHARCHNVMSSMTQGRWERKTMTPSDVQRMNKFHKHVREVEHRIPRGLQRQDGRCGNLSFDSGDGEHPKWFRALCDVDGDKPCCYHGQCVKRPLDQCKCTECYDMRNPLHAEYATWRPRKTECQIEEMSVGEICRLLKDATLYFIGDSFIRHIYTTLLMAVRGDNLRGAFHRNIPEKLKTNCSGIYMFTEKECRLWVDSNVRVCPGHTTHLQLIMTAGNSDIRRQVAQLSGKPRTLAFIGLGFHGRLRPEDTFKKVMRPLLEQQKKSQLQWPRLVWANIHHWGTLKNPNLPRQSVQYVFSFNEKMKQYLQSSDVAILDTFNMTEGVESFDGSHYGYGVNKVKVQILLEYLKELQLSGKW